METDLARRGVLADPRQPDQLRLGAIPEEALGLAQRGVPTDPRRPDQLRLGAIPEEALGLAQHEVRCSPCLHEGLGDLTTLRLRVSGVWALVGRAVSPYLTSALPLFPR